jgi:hypothetical protein
MGLQSFRFFEVRDRIDLNLRGITIGGVCFFLAHATSEIENVKPSGDGLKKAT